MKYLKKILAGLALAAGVLALVTGCGGGGSDDDGIDIAGAEGAYAGALVGDPGGRNRFNLLILENNELYGLYGTEAGGVFSATGLIQGNGTSGSTSFTSANSISYFGSTTGAPSPLVSTYTASSITGTITSAAVTRTFAASEVPAGTYTYTVAATTSSVSGTFSALTDLLARPVTLNVVGGTFSGNVNGTCPFNGTIFPRPSGKNVFNVNLTFTAAVGCDFPSQTFTGVAISFNLGGGTQELLLAAVNGARTSGIAFTGTR